MTGRFSLWETGMIETLAEISRDPGFEEGKAWRFAVEANDWIIMEDDIGDTFYFVGFRDIRVSGQIELEVKRMVQPGICDLGEGDFFGESELFGARTRSALVRAITKGQLLEINGEYLSNYLNAHPALGYRFLR